MRYNSADSRGIVSLIGNYEIPPRSVILVTAKVSNMYESGNCVEFEPSTSSKDNANAN